MIIIIFLIFFGCLVYVYNLMVGLQTLIHCFLSLINSFCFSILPTSPEKKIEEKEQEN